MRFAVQHKSKLMVTSQRSWKYAMKHLIACLWLGLRLVECKDKVYDVFTINLPNERNRPYHGCYDRLLNFGMGILIPFADQLSKKIEIFKFRDPSVSDVDGYQADQKFNIVKALLGTCCEVPSQKELEVQTMKTHSFETVFYFEVKYSQINPIPCVQCLLDYYAILGYNLAENTIWLVKDAVSNKLFLCQDLCGEINFTESKSVFQPDSQQTYSKFTGALKAASKRIKLMTAEVI
uniref:AlNc14C243G9517 protein n=1 Tax=Albugo laibachii Nc14 TaxID=890382 RepID=F0WT31_9STRA|nr:AlNc14C243G9517 [Albugo laibachii Nc14]|eukprot:CCA24517.1 AlNc14C243G9517 [Albugo laibachii Nc14]